MQQGAALLLVFMMTDKIPIFFSTHTFVLISINKNIHKLLPDTQKMSNSHNKNYILVI